MQEIWTRAYNFIRSTVHRLGTWGRGLSLKRPLGAIQGLIVGIWPAAIAIARVSRLVARATAIGVGWSIKRIGWAASGIREFLLDVGIIALIATAALILWVEFSRNVNDVTVVVEWLPQDLTQAGNTNRMVEKRIRDHMNKIASSSSVQRTRRRIGTEGVPDVGDETPLAVREEFRDAVQQRFVSIGGTDFQLSALVAYWRALFTSEDPKFVAEITKDGDGYRFRARSQSYATVEPNLRLEKRTDIDRVLELGALAIVARTDPLTYGEFIYTRDPVSALAACDGELGKSDLSAEQRYRALKLRAAAQVEKGQYVEATTAAKAAVSIMPNESQGHRVLGDVLRISRGISSSIDRAVEAYDDALRLDPTNVDALVGKCQAYLAVGNRTMATEACDGASRLAPKASNVRLAQAGVSLVSRDKEKARDQLKQLIDDDPDQHEARYHYGRLLIDARLFEQAVEQLEVVVAAWPRFEPARVELERAKKWLPRRLRRVRTR